MKDSTEGEVADENEASLSSRGLSRVLAFALVLAVYWVPALLGGNYASGDFALTPIRVLALLMLVGMVVASVRIAAVIPLERWWGASVALLVSAGLVNFGLAVSAAWVHVPPFEVLLVAFIVAAAPMVAMSTVQRRAVLVLACAAVSTALSSFWMALFHPYR